MINNKYFLIIHLLLFSFCLCEISEVQETKLFNGFVDYYNNLPNQVYQCDEGTIQSTQQVNETTYQIVVKIKVTEYYNIEATKFLKCTATIQDSDDDVTVTNSHCEDSEPQSFAETATHKKVLEAQDEVNEPTIERKPVQLDNEVQSDTAITSGEQFIAIPRNQPSASCSGCTMHVNPQAAGVSDLANLGVRHLDIHEPSVKHSLDSVIDVERQVQVVNGVRYILTLSIHSNSCTEVQSENCASSKICKITILVKPWVKLPYGGNYRAILANNCTEGWLYGDNGEVLPEPSIDTSLDSSHSNISDEDIQVKHNTNVQSQPNQERSLTDEEIKNLQDQIIPNNAQFQETTEPYRPPFTASPDGSDVSKQHAFKVKSSKHSENSIPVTESEKTVQQTFNVNMDKKKAIDEMLDFFDFSGFKPKSKAEDVIPRVRRSYDYDLQVLSLAEDFHGIKNSIKNARFMYEMAQAMVDYLNEMDMEVKNRAVKNVVKAEEETENLQRFIYIQARVTIPCDKVECEPRDEITQICNGVIDSTNENSPQILNTFCYNDNKERDYRDVVKEIPLDDPVLQKLAEDTVKKIESESNSQYAMRINKIASAITQVTSGTLTKFSVIVENIKCNKSVPMALRINCTVLEQLGSKICEVIIHERHWLKERKISYTCTDRPVDMIISKAKSMVKNVTIYDPEINEMLQEAIQYLETQSDKNNKQKIVNVKSISSQIIAGFLTKIEFVVGYTNCTDENYSRDELSKCELLKDEGLRSCKAQIWDRSWIMDGRQVEVTCDDAVKSNEIDKTRKKRSIDLTEGQAQQNVSKDNNLEYKQLAIESLYKFMRSTSSRQHYELIKVDKVMVRDVSGKLIKILFSISPTNCLIQTDGLLSSPKCDIVNPKNILHCRSKILENIWIHKKQYFVNCNVKDNDQQKNTHGLKERNPSDSKYYQLAEESLIKYLQDTGNPHHKVVRVEKVTTQIVSGLLTRIDFVVSPKNQSDGNNKTISCHSEILEKHWLGTKNFNVSCQMKQKKKIDDTDGRYPQNAEYMQIAVESLEKYIKNKPESNLLRVTFIDKVVQVGEIIKIRFVASHKEDDDGDTLCYTEFSKSKNDLVVKCHLIGAILNNKQITEEDPNYYKYVQLADESLHNYLQNISISQPYTILNIESVTVQWDEGIKTLIKFIISPIDFENSELQGKQCLAEIRERPWLHKKNLDVKCELEKDLYRTKRYVSHARVRRQLDGGVTVEDPTDPRYKALAEESLRKYKVDSGITQPLEVARVEKVTTQIVSGLLTRIDFLVSGSQDSRIIQCYSEVVEQSWLNKKEITVDCSTINERINRDSGMPGFIINQDPTDHRYEALAEESLRKYIIDSGITHSLKVALVEKVTTQVVSGTLIKIDFLVSGSQDSRIMKCHSEVWEQSWLNKKEITVDCSLINEKVRRDSGMLGGITERDPTEPEYRLLAEESLRKYMIDSGIAHPLKVAHVEKVTTQVVSGTLTRIDFLVSGSKDSRLIKCHSEVSEQSWLNKKEITVDCGPINEKVRRDSGVPGGIRDQDPTDPRYKALAEVSLQKYIRESGTTQSLYVAHVERVTTQIVSGSLTSIDFIVSSSRDSNTINCHSEVWEQPWLNNKQIDVSCQNIGQRSKRELIGGSHDQDPTDPRYKVLAEESLRKYVNDSGIAQPLKVARVEKVTTQLVAGTLTKIEFLVSSSQDYRTIKCHSEVWERSWLNKKEITVVCSPINEIVTRASGMPGGITERDPTEPGFRVLAEESLQKYILESGTTESLQVVRVEKVSTQVVAGSLTRIDFLVSGSQDYRTIKCHSEVWERSWLNKKEITVVCSPINEIVTRPSGMPGGITERDPTESGFRVLAEESLQKYIRESGTTQSLYVAHVERVTTQIVSGTLTSIDFIVSSSRDSNTINCHSEVWEQPWLNNKQIDVSCQNDGQRGNRELIGGFHDQDPTEPRYKVLAEESLRKYMIDSGIAQPLKVARVEKVTTQVVSGTLTRIDFLVSGSQDYRTIKCHSEVWERSWLNKKEITVVCSPINEIVRRPSDMPGGIRDQDPTDPRYKALAEVSLQKYIRESGTTQSLYVAHVERVTTQIVSGTLTRIDFIVSSSRDSNTINCHSEVWEQPWLNNKQIDVSCQNIGQRSERELIGGSHDQDPTDPRYKVLAEESLRKYVNDSGIAQPLKVARVEKVTTQVVSGTLTRIDFLVSGSQDSRVIKCHSEVWEQSWLDKKEITIDCSPINEKARRASGMPGGIRDQDPTDPRYKALAEVSLQKYIRESGTTQSLYVAHVERVTTQIVSGTLTRIDFIVSSSRDSNTINCRSEVWEQPWLNNKQIDVSCQNIGQRSKRELIGGSHDQDPTDPRYKVLAEESLRKYVNDSGIAQPLKVARVEKVTTQVVSGTLTRIDFLVSGSQDSRVIKCHSEVWEQSWLNKKEITVDCSPINEKARRASGMPGGIRDQDPTDPRYKALAEVSLQKYIRESGTTQSLYVAHVERVTTQIVSGTLTSIDFIVFSSRDSNTINCHSEVWEQPWLNNKQIDVSCQNDGQRGNRELIGGFHDQDPTEPRYKVLAEESLRKYMIDSGIAQPLKVARVEKVTTQVVSGTLTRIDFLVSGSQDYRTIKCHSEVWERSWLNKKEITVVCSPINEIVRRPSGMPGGIRDQDPTDPRYKALAEVSLQKYIRESGTTQSLYVAHVERVTTQIVSGTLTRIDFTVSSSRDSNTINCHSEVWEQPWLNNKQIDVSCQNIGQRSERELIGGSHDQDPTDPRYKVLAEESLRKYVNDTGIAQPLKVARVEKVTTQVVSGTLTRIDFLVSGSQDSRVIKCHSEVWEQSWLDKKEITIDCSPINEKVRRALGMPGGIRDQDPTDPRYKALAEVSLQKYIRESGTTQSLYVAHVERVTTQIVSGTLTRIDFIVSSSRDSNTINCRSEVWEQPWLNNKQIDVSCQNIGQRSKRELIGGSHDQDPTDPRYKVLAEESLRKYVNDSGIAQPLKVARVEKVTTQVVSGTLTRIDFLVSGSQDSRVIKCHSEVWEQSWLDKKEITIDCSPINEKVRRALGMPGGIRDQDPTDPRYKALAEVSLQKYIRESGTTQSLYVAHVERVTTQIVSGTLTRIDFIVSSSRDSNTINCRSEVWEQPWLNNKQIDVSCQNIGQRSKRELIGGSHDQDPTDPRYKVLAEESLRKYVNDSGIAQPLKVARVEKVTTQVVSGTLTRIDFLVSGSQDSRVIKCHSEVWEQSWLNKKEITVDCSPINEKARRASGMPGGIRDQDPTDPRYKALAEVSLQKYIRESGTTQSLYVAHVERVTTQIVSGTLTSIDFIVSSSRDSNTINCHSEVWEQPWLNNKQIDVSCQNIGQRSKRELIGGSHDQDPTDHRYKVLAEESLRKYMIDSGIAQPLKVARVEKVTTQVVTGTLTRIDFLVSGSKDSRIIKCHSEVLEQSWLNKKEITVDCFPVDKRVSKDLGMPGGIRDQDPTEPRFRVLAEESLQKYILESGTTQSLEVVRVEKASTQVVAGSLTRIDFLVSCSQDSKTMKCHSEVLDPPRPNKKQITVDCFPVDKRVSKDLGKIGGIRDQDPTEPRFRVLAEESLQKYILESGTTQSLEVVRVEKASTQVVAGSLTRIDFLVSCSQDSKTMKCHSEVLDPPRPNKKKITVDCFPVDKRVSKDLGMPGGIRDQDPTEPRFRVLAEESLQKYILESGTTQSLEVVRVEKASTQVVAGSLTRIDFLVSCRQDSKTMKCHSEVWDPPRPNKKKITVDCFPVDKRLSKDSGKIGGITDQDPTEPRFRVLAEESLQKYILESGTTQSLKVVRVEKASTQVVAGSLTRIDFIVSSSRDLNTINCHSEVREQPWLTKKKIDVSCQNDQHSAKKHVFLRSKRELVGGSHDQDPTEPRYKVLAEESLRKYVIDSGIAQPLKVARVEKVTTQIVAGTLTKIDFLVSGSQDSKTIECHSKVWEQSWLSKKEITVECSTIKERVKRDLGLLGGASEQDLKTSRQVLDKESNQGNSSKKDQGHVSILRGHIEEEQDPNKPEYKLLAEESLRKYQQKRTVNHKVLEVNRVLTRVVSGLKYKIDFSAVPTVCSVNVSSIRARSCKTNDDVILYCHTEIWDRPWLNQKKIDVQCNGPTQDNDNDDLEPSDLKKNNDEKYIKLAEEASEKYLTTSDRKYAHKVTEIHSATEHIADGILTNIYYSLSPTTCLRNETINNTSCKLKQPLIVFDCNAKIQNRPWLHVEKEIKVTCKKTGEQKVKKHKRELGVRNTRQIGDDDDEIDEDTVYYYADRALQHINDQSHSNNLHKLVSIHDVQNSMQMKTLTVRMYIEVAETFCMRHRNNEDLRNCAEMFGLNHRLCLARLWPSPDDELVVRHVSVVCDDEADFIPITGVIIPELLRISIIELERAPENKYKLVHQGEPQVIPSLDSNRPFKINFVVATTNCSKDVNLDNNPFQCYINSEIPSKACHSFIWLKTDTKFIRRISAKCTAINRVRRSALDPANVTLDNLEIQNLVTASLEKLEMQSIHRYKQRVLQINSHSTKITSGKVTTIDFDVGYTSCLKYEWVENITTCNFLEHLPRRRCVAQITERLWINNGKNIDVNCVDDETPLESHIEFESAEMANTLAREALKHIEAKYPHPSKQKVVRIFSLEKQVVAGIHYKMKVEVGFTDCVALSDQKDCKLLKNHSLNKFCRVNVWVRPWTDHPPNFRVSCDYQEGTTHDLYHHVQAEQLFYNFLTTYNPSYVNNYSQMQKRFEIFKNNIKKIHEFNVHEKGTAVYGVTRFTDLTYEEFRTTYMGLKTNLSNENQVPMKKADIPDIKVPPNFDWREYDAVTEVKDQGSCGSCWAFSVTGNIEGQWKMQSGQLVSLSEQELVDCDKLDDGCNGGLPDNAYRAIEQLGGLELESDYPYEGVDEKCEFNKTKAKVQISGAVNITANETGMAQWLVHNGPISIGINANGMQFYMGGISHPWKALCNPSNLDHGVLIVGYGVKDYPLFHKELPYWIIKNSWGKSWGEQGYYRVYRGDGTCGLNQMASSAVI